MIGGFVILFSVIISILNSSKLINILNLVTAPICTKLNIPSQLITSFCTGILEITNGINLITAIKLKNISLIIILTSFLLGLGGLSVLLQVLSIVSKSDLSIKPYIIGKILHGFFSALYTSIFIYLTKIVNFHYYFEVRSSRCFLNAFSSSFLLPFSSSSKERILSVSSCALVKCCCALDKCCCSLAIN